LVSGSFEGKTGPAKSNVLTAMISMDANSSFNLLLPAQNNVAIYVLEGKVRINEKLLETAHSLLNFDQTEGTILLEAINSTKILLMAGTPINEPLVTHGPFVMNTQTELLEAMRDYRQGKMGFLAG
jgi:redox-sensitive bicupin YhaK (pirin superfamily)